MLEGWLRIFVGLIFLGLAVAVGMLGLIPILPSRTMRIRWGNFFGSVVGSTIMKISGCEVRLHGTELVHSSKPAIYAANHTSIFDAFTSIWISPTGTVGVAKKEILYYPFYGLAWVLAGNLLLDRGKTERAKRAMRKMGEFVRDNGLHLYILPEGTRATDGRLLPFKKGVAHLALQTGLPIVPVMTVGAHKSWLKGSLTLHKVPIDITFLPPIDTSDWTLERIDEHIAELRQVFIDALPDEQKPLPAEEKLAA